MKHDIEKIYTLTQQELHDYVIDYISQFNEEIISIESFFIISAPKQKAPYLVAHLDTKYDVTPYEVVLVNKKKYEAYDKNGYRCILGADDRNGVWTMLELYEQYHDKLGFIFTWNEEKGCVGARNLAVQYQPFLKENISYFLQIDRRGTKDLAYYSTYDILMNQNFRLKLEDFHPYRVVPGTSTDVKHLSSSAKVSSINISAGYHYEHTTSEYCEYEYLLNLPNTVIDLINHLGYQDYPLNY
jgi:acetylornithine deacetylase/succinyl-diaminopimelate desuccinylase-like protein